MSKKKKNLKENKKKPLKNWLFFSGIALQMLIVIGGSVWLGIYLDEYRATNFPIFTLALSLLGVFVALYQVISSLKKFLD